MSDTWRSLLSGELLQRETVTGEEIRHLLGMSPGVKPAPPPSKKKSDDDGEGAAAEGVAGDGGEKAGGRVGEKEGESAGGVIIPEIILETEGAATAAPADTAAKEETVA